MINNELLGYVKKQLSTGASKETIASNLKGAGWDDADINEVFSAITPVVPPSSTPNTTPIPVSSITPLVMSNIAQAQPIQSIQNNIPYTVHAKNKKIIPVIAILILLILAGGVVAYAYYSGMSVTLSNLIPKTMDSSKAIKSVKYDVTANIDFSEIKNMITGLPSLGINSTQVGFTVKGVSDISDSKNIKNSSVISLNMGPLSATAETRMVDSSLYFILTKIPALGFMPVDALVYQNKWFSLPITTTDDQIVGNPLTSISGIDSSVTKKITSEQKNRLYSMIKDAHFIKQTTKLPNEVIAGESSYHFAFDLDKEGITTYLQSLKEYVNTIGKDDSGLSAFDTTSISKELENLKDFKGEIWIGKDDKLIHKISINFGVLPDLAKEEKVKINLVAIFSNYNQPVSIVAPAESTPFMELMSGIVGGLMNVKQNGDKATSALDQLEEARQKGKEAALKTFMSTNMRTNADMFYSRSINQSYSGLCALFYSKGAKKEIEDKYGGTEFICKDASKAYAISVKLPTANYFCVDSTGTAKITATLPSGTVCPVK